MRDSAHNRSLRFNRTASPLRSLALVLVLLVLALALVLLDRSGRLTPVRTQLVSLLGPLLAVAQRTGDQLGGVGRGLSDVQQLREHNAALEQRVSVLRDKELQNDALKRENEQLRKQLQIEQKQPWKLQRVDVVAVTPDVGRHVMMISAGSEDKVKVGMAVIGQEGGSPTALVGVVEQVSPHGARVLLISDFTSEITVKLLHQGAVTDGVVKGQFQRGTWLRLEEVDRSVPLAIGDQVSTAGLTAKMNLDLPNAAIPSSIPIGIVERVWTEGYRQFADLRPYLTPDQVRYAWVILSHDD